MSRISVSEKLAEAKQVLKKCGFDSYSLDARLLLMEATGLDAGGLLTNGGRLLTDTECELYDSLIAKRAAHMPVAYILNRCEFMALPFFVNDSVLIPRPDTEILVEAAIEKTKRRSFSKVLEIGTGSGCISVSLVRYNENLRVTASDISEAAITVASKNAELNGVSGKIKFVLSDLFQNIREKYDLIISNPPYIAESEMAALPRSIVDYEPRAALWGGGDGLDFYRRIINESRDYLTKNGMLMFEIGCLQAADVTHIMEQNKYANIEIIKDLAGLDRAVICERNENYV